MASTPFSGSSLYSAEQTETAVRDDEYRRRREKCGGHTTLINCARCSRPAGVIMDDPAVTGRTERRDWAKIRTRVCLFNHTHNLGLPPPADLSMPLPRIRGGVHVAPRLRTAVTPSIESFRPVDTLTGNQLDQAYRACSRSLFL